MKTTQTTATEYYETNSNGVVAVTYTIHVFGLTINSIRRDSDNKSVVLPESELADIKNLLEMYRQDAAA
jgi:uncharacterized protein with HEPN domain